MTEDAAVAETEDEVLPEEAEAETSETETEEEVKEEAKSKEESEPEDSSTSKKEDGVQKRIDELTRKYREQERLADYYREQAEKQEASQPQSVDPGKKLSDFDYDEEAYTKYLVDFATQEAQKKVSETTQRDQAVRKQAQFAAREAEFSETADDYHRVTRDANLRITPEMVDAIQESDNGPGVLYYLGKNPEVASSLASMSPLAMAREIGRIEATKLVKPEPSTTKAPEPPPKIDAKSNPTTIKPNENASDKLSIDEWVKRREKQLYG